MTRGARFATYAVIRACVTALAAAVPLASVGALDLACSRAEAASIETLTTKRDAGRYAVSLRAHLDVSVLAVYGLFADVANWKRLSPDLRRLEILDQHRDGAMELSMAFQACVLWYCRVMYGMPDVFFTPRADGGDIYLTLRPNVGDFRAGEAHWRFRGSSSGTELQFTAEVEPNFTVPLIIGPWLMARWLRSEALQTSLNVEALAHNVQGALAAAQQEPPGVWQDSAFALAPQIGTDRSAADAALKALIEKHAGDSAFQIAEVYALRKDAKATFEWLDRAWNNRDTGMLYDPFILRYKDDPRFVAFLPQGATARAGGKLPRTNPANLAAEVETKSKHRPVLRANTKSKSLMPFLIDG